MANFGHFNETGSEYVITDFNTPRPLLNYMWNAKILSGVNHFGGGSGSYGDKAASYIDPQGRGRAILIRNGNRYFYIRDEKTGEFWNPGWYPAKTQLESYSCTQGLGYSIIQGQKNGVKVTVTGSVAAEDPVEVWNVKVENNSGAPCDLKVYSFVEFSLEGYPRYSEYDSYVHAEYDPDLKMVYAENNAQERPHDWFNGFIATNGEVSGYETSKKSFLGTYGDITAPQTVVSGKCSGKLAACERMVGVLETPVKLQSGVSYGYDVLIGSTNSRTQAEETVKKLFAPGKLAADFDALKQTKQAIINSIQVETPDEVLNDLTNNWLKQQVQLCAEAGRSTGKGFRDQLQDSWAIASFNPALAKEKILETLEHAYCDGRCVRGWLPLDHHIYSDGPVWVAPTVNAYMKETGDFDFLNNKVAYLDKEPDTVWEHILTVTRYSSDDLGTHNLVKAHDGDWNDSLNGIGTDGKGESVWTSIALYQALHNVAEMARDIVKDPTVEQEMLERAERIKKAINDMAWDGEWYLAAFNDEGRKVGSHTEETGMIYLNSQTWAVMTGVAEGERAQQCLKSVDSHLDSPYGPLTLYPPYTQYDPTIGRLSGFVPGIWENGTPYCHGCTFKVVSDLTVGRGNQAYETLSKIMPDSAHNPSEHSGCEPYVFTNMYFGPANPRAGETTFAWVTGTAGWVFRAVTQYMAGFYPGYETITIQPCLPDSWDGFNMKRTYRGDVYQIRISNPNHQCTGVASLTVDGQKQESNQIPIFKDGKEHIIEVVLG